MQLVFLKTKQLTFTFGPRKPVEKPGSHGSTKWYYDEQGRVVYGERPPTRYRTPIFEPPTARPKATVESTPPFKWGDVVSSNPDSGRGVVGQMVVGIEDRGEEWGGWHIRVNTGGVPTWAPARDFHLTTPPVPTPAPASADEPRFAPGDIVEVDLGQMQDSRGRVTDQGWRRVVVEKVENGSLSYRDEDGSGSGFLWLGPDNVRRPGESPPPKLVLAPPAPPVTPPAVPERPTKAKTFTEGKHVNAWEVLEGDYQQSHLAREIRRLENNIEAYRIELESGGTKESRVRPVVGVRKLTAAKRQQYEFWLKMYEKDLAAIARGDPNKLEYIRRNGKLRYVKIVKSAISSGKPVPMEVIAQSTEFRKALTGRQRYEKGRHTSFANISAAVDTSTKAAHGFKCKRQDGKPITTAQKEEIVNGVKEVEEVLGSLKGLMDASDLTIAHTNGKHPFMRGDAGGLYSIGERTISIGIRNVFGKEIPALAHELAHWLDYDAGRKLGAKSRVFRGNGAVDCTSLAEAEADAWAPISSGYGRALTDRAVRTINDTHTVRRLLKSHLKDAKDKEGKGTIEEAKVMLGPYWREPREVFARLVEQFVATKRGKRGISHDSPEAYGARPGWWTPEVFAEMAPDVEREIKRRLEALRA